MAGGFVSFKGRTLDGSGTVRVYRNLHTGKWSIRAVGGPDAGRVLGHALFLTLTDAAFIVSAAGNRRVREERVKNVHAYVQGVIVPDFADCSRWTAVTYNPYKFTSFVRREDHEPVTAADFVILGPDGKAFAKNPC